MYDPIVFDRKAVFMQRIADFVRAGYTQWTAGKVRPDRARALVKKFVRLYGIDKTRHQRAYAKAKSEACAVLLMYAPYVGNDGKHAAKEAPSTAHDGRNTVGDEPHTEREASHIQVFWILLVTDGEHPARQLERLADAATQEGRLTLTGYELVQLPRSGQTKPAWTWRMQDDTYQGWRLRLIAAARRHSALLESELRALAGTPGFAGSRVQLKKLGQLASGEHKRRSPSSPPIVIPKFRYLQRLPDGGMSLSVWLRRYTK
ncbi:MAG: hypothetical protein C4516_09040 [Oxalobacter sp.]|nr:MAG: hypothetical protein C4516_09040 [Oxalobacter sp.]